MDQVYEIDNILASFQSFVKLLREQPFIEYTYEKTQKWKKHVPDKDEVFLPRFVTDAPWISINSKFAKRIIVVDIDPKDYDQQSFERLLKTLPPNWKTLNPEKTNSIQLGYILDRVYFNPANFSERKKKQTSSYSYEKLNEELSEFNNVTTMLYDFSHADHNMKNFKAKNPLSTRWQTEWIKKEYYKLEQIADGIEEYFLSVEQQKIEDEHNKIQYLPQTKKEKNENYVFNENSTNCKNFEHLRLIAYEWINTFKEVYKDKKQTKQALFNFLKKQEDPEIYGHQTPAERQATLISIVDFCVDRYAGQGKYARANKIRKEKQMQAVDYLIKNGKLAKRSTKTEREHIAKKFNVTEETAQTYVTLARKKLNITIQTKGENILKLKIKDGKNFAEIAEILGKSISTVKTIYYREIKKREQQGKKFLDDAENFLGEDDDGDF